MKRKILIEAYRLDKNQTPIRTRKIICGHLDASRNITVLSENIEIDENNKEIKTSDIHIPEKIDHFNIYEGIITIYYQNGNYLEITRYFEGEPFIND